MAHHSSSHKLPFGAARLCQDLATLFNDRQCSDIQFKVGGGNSTSYNESEMVTIYAHSLILRCRSRYFAAMLDEDKHWKESSNGVIYKPNISPSTFQDVLHYIYTGNVRTKISENIIELITAADEMDLEELSNECQAELIRIIKCIFSEEMDNGGEDENGGTIMRSTRQQIPIDVAIRTHIIPALNLASSHSLSHLSQKLQAIMLPHMSVIIRSPDAYAAFISGVSSEVLYKIIASDNLAITERSVWDLALGWGCHQMELSKVVVETQLSYPEDDEDDSESSTGTTISGTQLSQLKTKLAPLLPAIRFSLLDSEDYQQIFGIMSYFLPRRRSFEINRFFLKPGCTELLDMPRKETTGRKIFSKILHESTAWELLRKYIFEAGVISWCLSLKHLKFELLFRGSEHGFLAKSFHRYCDNKGPTLLLVRSADGHIFGGVNFNHWKSDYSESSSSFNFLFALPDGSHRTNPAIFRVNPSKVQYSTHNSRPWGPVFGSMVGNDLAISDYANTSQSHSHLPSCYYGSGASRTALAGAEQFQVSEYEVFTISS